MFNKHKIHFYVQISHGILLVHYEIPYLGYWWFYFVEDVSY